MAMLTCTMRHCFAGLLVPPCYSIAWQHALYVMLCEPNSFTVLCRTLSMSRMYQTMRKTGAGPGIMESPIG